MCGIAGLARSPYARLPEPQVCQAMNDVIAHRGPDDEGFYRDDHVHLGMRRLAIIDLGTGHQPIHNPSQDIWLVFNGEIYNYRELRDPLEADGYPFYTLSDSEVIVALYQKHGIEFLNYLNGMFAIALWDKRSGTLILARDRFGEKPLFYSMVNGCLAFASELKSLLQVPGFSRELDESALLTYVFLGYVQHPRSIFRQVAKVEPGAYVVFKEGQIRKGRYYDLVFTPRAPRSEAAELEELDFLMDQAVRSRMVSDVPLGACLSGGLDSSVVVALMARHMGRPVKTFTIGFREEAYNELDDARRVARILGTEHHELLMEPRAVDLMDGLVWHLDEPFADSSAIPTHLVSQLARQEVKMVLSGDAGDECFGGYSRYVRHMRIESWRRMKPLAAGLFQSLGACTGGHVGQRLRNAAERFNLPFPESYLTGFSLTRADQAAHLLGTNSFREAYRVLDHHPLHAGAVHLLDQVVSVDFHSYLPDDILVKVDRMAMANSLESRAPFLDHRLVEFALGLSPGMRVQGGRGKHLLRQLARQWFGPEVLDKPKKGFGVPISQWFRHDLKEFAQDIFHSRTFVERGCFQAARVQRCLDEHQRQGLDHGALLWMCFSFELWARRFLDSTRDQAA